MVLDWFTNTDIMKLHNFPHFSIPRSKRGCTRINRVGGGSFLNLDRDVWASDYLIKGYFQPTQWVTYAACSEGELWSNIHHSLLMGRIVNSTSTSIRGRIGNESQRFQSIQSGNAVVAILHRDVQLKHQSFTRARSRQQTKPCPRSSFVRFTMAMPLLFTSNMLFFWFCLVNRREMFVNIIRLITGVKPTRSCVADGDAVQWFHPAIPSGHSGTFGIDTYNGATHKNIKFELD